MNDNSLLLIVCWLCAFSCWLGFFAVLSLRGRGQRLDPHQTYAGIDFPSSPSIGQTYVFNGRAWTWNGSAWVRPS